MPGMKTYICENKNAKTNIGIIVAAFKKNGVVKIRSNSLENRENTKKNKRANDEKYLNIIDSSFGELSFLQFLYINGVIAIWKPTNIKPADDDIFTPIL